MRRSHSFLRAVVLLTASLTIVLVTTVGADEDLTTRIDANQINSFVTNLGGFGFDVVRGDAGLEYPRGSGKFATFAGGLFLGGMTGSELRVAVHEYSTEFVPGPMVDGGPSPDTPAHRVYKLDCTTGPGSADYDGWPAAGAPVDSLGTPHRLGDQTLWSVFNDAEPDSHNIGPGSTAPLGIEVRHTTYAFDRPGALGNTVFHDYTFLNRGSDALDSMYASIWSDPDIGASHSVRCGCDPELDLGYGYKTNEVDDPSYGLQTPAVGYRILQSPMPPGQKMTSFATYTNGLDPASARESYNLMRGLQRDGTDRLDPNMEASVYWNSGDPVSGTGWLEEVASNKKMMVSTGPFSMAPGDSVHLVVALIIGHGTSNLDSVTQLRAYASEVADMFASESLPAPVDVWPGDLDQSGVVDANDLFPLGMLWASEGHACKPGFAWEARPTTTWSDAAATVADANGDGIVSMPDLLAIGLNWGRTHQTRGPSLFDPDRYDPKEREATFLAIYDAVRGSSMPGRVAMLEQIEAWLDLTPEDSDATPAPHVALRGAYPNPFTTSAAIEYELARPETVSLTIYDVRGRRVRGLVSGTVDAGTHSVAWDGLDDRSRPVASGVYIYELRAAGIERVGQLLRIR